MKSLHCLAISDTHDHDLTKLLAGRKADILFIAGDWSYKATFQEIANFKQELKDIRPQFREIVWINGNHELGMESFPFMSKEVADHTNTRYLEDSEYFMDRVENDTSDVLVRESYIRVWGSPVTPWFGGWAWNAMRGPEIASYWEKIPEGLDVLMTHGPAANTGLGILPWTGEDVGCVDLYNRLINMEKPPKVFISGHIHCTAGKTFKLLTKSGKVIDCYNVAICTEQYKAINPVTEFYI